MTPLILLFACSGKAQEICVTTSDFQALTHLSLPPSAEHLQCYNESGIDTATLARFNLPAADVAPFFAGLGLEVPLKAGLNPLRPERAWPLTWWKADATGNFRGAEGQVGARAIKLRVEDTDDGAATVFLLTFTL